MPKDENEIGVLKRLAYAIVCAFVGLWAMPLGRAVSGDDGFKITSNDLFFCFPFMVSLSFVLFTVFPRKDWYK